MVFSYHTIQGPSTGIYKEKGSKFMAFAYPVSSEAEVKAVLAGLRKEYFDARHHCYAYVLGPEKNLYRASDDGEPNHSAGDPILGQIRSRQLTNVLVVVVRYFGGVKLGVSGLITAYKEAAADALQQAIIKEEEVTNIYTLTYDYAATPDVMKMVKDVDLDILNQSFDDRCQLQVRVRLRHQAALHERIEQLKIRKVAVDIQ
jgi:uncharacterized YigZ family protein